MLVFSHSAFVEKSPQMVSLDSGQVLACTSYLGCKSSSFDPCITSLIITSQSISESVPTNNSRPPLNTTYFFAVDLSDLMA